MFRLDGQVVLVTGSSRGIGRAIALACARQGAAVVVSSRRQDACDLVAEEIRGAGGEALAMACNVSDRAQLQALVDATLARFGRIDTVIGNAASNPVFGPMADVDDLAFDKIMATNLKANVWLAHMSLPHMAERGSGSFIVISSVSAMTGSRMLGVYALSKAADFQLVRNLAVEWGSKGIRANCIAPGLVRTDFARAIWDDARTLAYYESITPLKRIGEPEDIAPMAVFLASAESSFLTGQTFVADGGLAVREVT